MILGGVELVLTIRCIFQVLSILIPKIKTRLAEPGVSDQFSKLLKNMLFISGLLEDFETKQLTEKSVGVWLIGLKEAAYDLDDLCDEINTHIMRQSYAMSSPTIWDSLASSLFLRPPATTFDKKMMPKIQDINKRLDDIYNEGKAFTFPTKSSHTSRLLTTYSIDESVVHGREEEKLSVIKLLFGNGDDISVISIVGMGGIGKTTLAQLVYNDKDVQEKFDVRVWVYVSHEFSMESVTKSIHEQLMGTTSSSNLLPTLQGDLRDRLARKKFLIVLDDVWNTNYMAWDHLRTSFNTGVPGSRIIVTTRDVTVASIVGSGHLIHRMKLLTNDDCLKILTQHALMDFKDSVDLRNVALRLVERCKGVPLAAKVIGGNLRNKGCAKWESALEIKTWDLAKQNGILPVLLHSYYHLPNHLKNLFAYCSLFPKGYEFDKNDLVYLWMGEGFLENPSSSRSKEVLGNEYFDELLSRCFFQHVSGSDTKFVMHDHMHALAQSVGGRIYCCLDEKMDPVHMYQVPLGTRHCSFPRHKYETFQKFKAFSNVRGLRSFVAMPIESQRWSPSFLSNKILVEQVPQMQSLRVLSISGYESIKELPNDICKLIHLRYLNLSGTGITTLPDSLDLLINLETLLIKDCYSLNKLPASFGNLLNLRHFDNSGTIALKDMPIEICNLRSLQTMPKVVLGKGKSFGLKELGQLEDLNGTLAIHNLQCVTCIEDVRKASLNSKDKLDVLMLTWGTYDGNSSSEISESCVLEELRPHKNLSTMMIASYRGVEFPRWTGDDSYNKLSSISIIGCSKCTSLPSLGCLPELKHLQIEDLPNVEIIKNDFFGSTTAPFPKLEVLCFDDLPRWRKWEFRSDIDLSRDTEMDPDIIKLPNLQELSLTKCGNLVDISYLSFPTLCKLSLKQCDKVLLKRFVDLRKLSFLKLDEVSGLSHFPLRRNIPQNLRRLEISKCPQLMSLKNLPSNLQVLQVDGCGLLKVIQHDSMNRDLRNLDLRNLDLRNLDLRNLDLRNLEKLEISNCHALKSLPTNMSNLERLYMCSCLGICTSPETLKTVRISGCRSQSPLDHKLRFYALDNIVNLFIHQLTIEEFPPSKDNEFPHLKSLYVGECKMLMNLRCNISTMKSLKSLSIRCCRGLENFPSSDLPPNLLFLEIEDCKTLKPLKQWDLHRLSSLMVLSLKQLEDEDCSFVFPPSLVRLNIHGLQKLKSLAKGLEESSSLRSLCITNCPEISILPSDSLLRNLWHLRISDCMHLKGKCKQQWGNALGIPCFQVACFSDEDPRQISENEYWLQLVEDKMEGELFRSNDARVMEQTWEQRWKQRYRNGIK